MGRNVGSLKQFPNYYYRPRRSLVKPNGSDEFHCASPEVFLARGRMKTAE